ncbi:uncharacterized protein LOC134257355, partial [Saccostrea cucullata]|uniref:uncharacterized protein LOC134257355 n=1 Tax=Saccostrea cuccullata TaxID=36930 RepID=UPI002ED2F482
KRISFSAPLFDDGKLVAHVESHDLTEASGLAPSRTFQNVLYTHNDGGDDPYIFAINATSGALISSFKIANARNHDWEDIAVGPCGNSSCIYIADSGYRHSKSANTIYRVLEPDVININMVLPLDSTARYTWSEEESQTLMVDPRGEVYLISVGHNGHGMVSHLPSSAWGNPDPVDIESTQFLQVHSHHHDPLSGDIRQDGSELLIQEKSHIYLFEIEGGDVMRSLTKTPVEVPFHIDGLTEAVCWSADGQKYYTLPEGHDPKLYVYSRINTESPGIVGNLIGK